VELCSKTVESNYVSKQLLYSLLIMNSFWFTGRPMKFIQYSQPFILLGFLSIISCSEPKDLVPPSILVISPVSNTSVSGTVDVNCNSSDNRGVKKVELFINGVSTGMDDSSEPYNFQWNTFHYNNGFNVLTVRSFDINGNMGISDPVRVKVENSFDFTIYGGEDQDIGRSIIQDIDGGVILVGSTRSYGSGHYDVWMIKSKMNGEKEWDHTFGGIYGEQGNSIQGTTDNGFIIVGSRSSYNSGGDDVWLIKTDSNGDEQWNKSFFSRDGEYTDRGYCVRETIDGGFVIVGETTILVNGGTDLWIIKTDSNGDEEWNHLYGGDDYDRGCSVQQTVDGGFIITGWTQSFGPGFRNMWIIKLDGNGVEEWNRIYGNSMVDYSGYSVIQTTDGGYVITGSGYSGMMLVKLRFNGTEEWVQEWGNNSLEVGYSVKQTMDGGLVITGMSFSEGYTNNSIWLVKTNSVGEETWSRTFPGNEGRDVIQMVDGGYGIIGTTSSSDSPDWDLTFIETDSLGYPLYSSHN
jgi:hypothetical protein